MKRVQRPNVAKRRYQPVRRSRLERLEARCVLAAPTLGAIPNVVVRAGAPLHVALDGFDSDGDALTFSASISNSTLPAAAPLSTVIPTGNRSLRFQVAGFADPLEFQIFEDLIPGIGKNILNLAASGTYDNTIFHRIVKGFAIQGGDPNGDGIGGAGPVLNDEFHPDLQHTSIGLLSMAKTTDDTNQSQFFITSRATRELDYNHSIFGFMTAGETTRAAINQLGGTTNAGIPTQTVTLQDASVFVDRENGVLRLIAPEGATGTATVTVTVSDGTSTFQRSFQVTVLADNNADGTNPNFNGNPYLLPVNNNQTLTTVVGQPLTIEVSSLDVEGDPIRLGFSAVGPNLTVDKASIVVTPTNRVGKATLTITPAEGFVGTAQIKLVAGMLGTTDASAETIVDRQTITVQVVAPPAPTISKIAPDTGFSDSDRLTQSVQQIEVANVLPGALVQLFDGSTPIAEARATGTSVTILLDQLSQLGPGEHTLRASQTVQNRESAQSSPFVVTVDTTSPVIDSSPVLNIVAGQNYAYNVRSPEEGQTGFRYSLVAGPPGMTIDPQTGVVSWLAQAAQAGLQAVRVRASDAAGNTVDQPYSITVLNSPPVLTAIGVQTVAEQALLSFLAAATDSNLPGDALTFSLLNARPGMQIDGATGRFTWTPTEAEGPGGYTATVRVTDAGGQFDEQVVQFTVLEVPQPPTLAPRAPQRVRPNTLVQFVAQGADADLPARALTYSLQGDVPQGATLDPATGAFRWTPTAAQQGVFSFLVRVTDATGLFAEQTVVVKVSDGPLLEPLPDDVQIGEGQACVLQVQATHPLPGEQLVFSLGPGAPAGMTIDAQTGLLAWTPTEADGPGTFGATVRVTDAEGRTDTLPLLIDVAEVNAAPQFAALSAPLVAPGSRVQVQVVVSDADLPAQSVVFSLDPGAPSGAAIDPATGLLTWDVPADEPQGVRTIGVRATDALGGASVQQVEITVSNVGFFLFRAPALEALVVEPDVLSELLLAAVELERELPELATPSEETAASAGAPNFQSGPDTGVPHNVEGLLAEEELRRQKAEQEKEPQEDGAGLELDSADAVWLTTKLGDRRKSDPSSNATDSTAEEPAPAIVQGQWPPASEAESFAAAQFALETPPTANQDEEQSDAAAGTPSPDAPNLEAPNLEAPVAADEPAAAEAESL